jgi:hypothetical protein
VTLLARLNDCVNSSTHPRLVSSGAGATVFDNELALFFATNNVPDVAFANATDFATLNNPDTGVNVF